jgi:hypothetical protein
MNTTHNTPYFLRETEFRKYEHIIAEVVNQYPKICVFESYPLAVQTFGCRLRDAMKSLYTYKWSSSLIDVQKFLEIRHLIVVGPSQDAIYVGPRHVVKRMFDNKSPLGRLVEVLN